MVTMATPVETGSRTGYHGFIDQSIPELVTMVTLIISFQHSRTHCHGYGYLHHFHILELVTIVTLNISCQHSRTGHHGFSDQSISTF